MPEPGAENGKLRRLSNSHVYIPCTLVPALINVLPGRARVCGVSACSPSRLR
jgi:hypothetical protein